MVGELQGVDRRLCQGLLGCVLLGMLVWVFYAAVQSDLKRHLTEDLQMGGDAVLIAQFSLKMMGAGLITFVISVGVMLLIISGVWGGRAAHWHGLCVACCWRWISVGRMRGIWCMKTTRRNMKPTRY